MNGKQYEGRPERVRIYGGTVRTWTAHDERTGREIVTQRERVYHEYDPETGERVAVGSEDFTPERERLDLCRVWAWTWDGKTLNRGGHRWFDSVGLFLIRKTDRATLRRYIATTVPDAEVVQLRKC